ncbi:MAG: VOC family protein [Deltaproteobacteria bacterium]|nr:VOC family protein [Deltaproteobacteria bacterium]MBW2361651.1 VOC family protein [Deltaproteobacteria bacterium]
MLTGLDHVVVAVGDLPAAVRCTELLFGRPASWRGEHPSEGTANALFRLDNSTLELLAAHGEGPLGAAVRARLAAHGEGLVALAFGTEDAAACAEAWRGAGLEPRGPQDGLGRDVDSGAIRRWAQVDASPAATRGIVVRAIENRSPADVLPLCEARTSPEASVTALDHVVVLSADVAATRAVFGEKLGLRLALERSFEERGVRLLFFRVGGTTVEIGGRLDAEPQPDASDRFGGLAWRVADVAAAHARLVAAGFDVSDARDGAKSGTRVFAPRGELCGVPTLFIGPSA